MCEISVIVPVYNVERYLERCVQSILLQTFLDYELILVDDGSQDKSGEICDKYAQEYEQIWVIHKKNQGLALARKTGIENAKGKSIIFVDSDDWIHKDMLNKMYHVMKKELSQIVCCQYQRVDENGKKKKDVQMKTLQVNCKTSMESAYQMFVTRYLSSTACGKLIESSLFENVKFKGNLAIGEEHDMVIQLISLATKISILSDGYYFYFWRSGSISHAGYNEKYHNSFKNYQSIRNKASMNYVELKSAINAYFSEYEMAVITAMCRNQKYDWNVVHELQADLKNNIKDIMTNGTTAFYLKICALMIVVCPRLFIIFFRIIHLFTGR